jgi:hypothetical protein
VFTEPLLSNSEQNRYHIIDSQVLKATVSTGNHVAPNGLQKWAYILMVDNLEEIDPNHIYIYPCTVLEILWNDTKTFRRDSKYSD